MHPNIKELICFQINRKIYSLLKSYCCNVFKKFTVIASLFFAFYIWYLFYFSFCSKKLAETYLELIFLSWLQNLFFHSWLVKRIKLVYTQQLYYYSLRNEFINWKSTFFRHFLIGLNYLQKYVNLGSNIW